MLLGPVIDGCLFICYCQILQGRQSGKGAGATGAELCGWNGSRNCGSVREGSKQLQEPPECLKAELGSPARPQGPACITQTFGIQALGPTQGKSLLSPLSITVRKIPVSQEAPPCPALPPVCPSPPVPWLCHSTGDIPVSLQPFPCLYPCSLSVICVMVPRIA